MLSLINVAVVSSPSTSMASEETPLLVDDEAIQAVKKHEVVYERFSNGRKRAIVAMVSWCGLIPCRSFSFSPPFSQFSKSFCLVVFVSGSFMPVIPDVAKDLHSNSQTVR